MARLAKHFNYDGPIAPLLAKREAPPQVADLTATVERTEGSPTVYIWTISTGGTDHSFDQIAVAGWDLSIHRSNPIVMYAHNGDALPIGRSISTYYEAGRLKSKMIFSGDGFAQRVKRGVDEGSLRAASVGFKPGDWEFARDPKRPGGINFTRGHVLLEWSVVNLPCNPQCLLERTADAATLSAAAPEQKPQSQENAKFAARLAALRRSIR